ncbi:nucleoporin Nup84/Nup107 family protein [Streptomyces canus]|uniref:nucleoporin Nup84/Nup107 family protein n=1 Tax=Streptomyces canus TaxID=58343 RepID=UPI0003AA8FA7|nr:nucleoporin Nup84/Nup107 family protein [Streptomyces canus]
MAARDAAERVWTMRFPPRPWPLPKARLVATDIAWTRGAAGEIRGPVTSLLLMLTGRPEAAREWAERTGEPWTGVTAPR